MNFAVVVPTGGADDPARAHALRTVLGHLRSCHDWPVIVEHGDEPWSKGDVVDRGVRRTDAPGLIIHDADVLVPPSALAWSVEQVEAGAAWSMPHRTVHRLNRRASMNVHEHLDGAPTAIDLERGTHPAPAGGGIVVLTRRVYELSGGIDPRFVGWGGEDISWARALDTLAGPGAKGDAPMTHLWHPPQRSRLRGGRGSRDNERLASRYLDAVGDVVAMAAVVTR